MDQDKIPSDLNALEEQLLKTFAHCFDMVQRKIECANGKKAIVVFSDGLVKKESIELNIIRPLIGMYPNEEKNSQYSMQNITQRMMLCADIKIQKSYFEATMACLEGDAIVFVEGEEEALVVQARGWERRGISPPRIQQSIRGPREGFTETLLVNVAMLRRKIKTPDLKTEISQVGSITKTNICIAYLEGVCDPQLVLEVKKRLNRVNVKYILESGHIEQLLEDKKKSIFATIGNNEKPDVVAAKLVKGRVAILVDGTPYVLTVPMLFTETFQAVEDYYSRPIYANFIRILRVAAYVVSIILPSFYVAMVLHHQQMLPDQLMNVLMDASTGVPSSILFEMVAMLILYELLREALVRLPSLVGSTVGIVGVFIIGDAAVSARLIGGVSVVIAALTYICSSVVNVSSDSMAIIRFALVLLGAILGLYGIFAGLFVLCAYLCSIQSFGYPYMMPFAPIRKRGLEDSVVRIGVKELLKRDGL